MPEKSHQCLYIYSERSRVSKSDTDPKRKSTSESVFMLVCSTNNRFVISMDCSFSVKLSIFPGEIYNCFGVDRSVRGRCCWIEDAKILSVR